MSLSIGGVHVKIIARSEASLDYYTAEQACVCQGLRIVDEVLGRERRLESIGDRRLSRVRTATPHQRQYDALVVDGGVDSRVDVPTKVSHRVVVIEPRYHPRSVPQPNLETRNRATRIDFERRRDGCSVGGGSGGRGSGGNDVEGWSFAAESVA